MTQHRLTTDDLVFLERLNKTPEGRRLMALLQAKLATREASIRTATGEEVYRTQGRLLEIDELIADLQEAGERLNRSQPARTSATRPVA